MCNQSTRNNNVTMTSESAVTLLPYTSFSETTESAVTLLPYTSFSETTESSMTSESAVTLLPYTSFSETTESSMTSESAVTLLPYTSFSETTESSMSTMKLSNRNFGKRTTFSSRQQRASTTMANQQAPNQHLPIWSIVLIIVLLAVILITAALLAVLYIRRSQKKLHQSQNRIELQSNNFTNKSYEIEKECAEVG